MYTIEDDLAAELADREVAPVMIGATGALVVFSLLLTVLAGPLMAYTDAAAASVLERTPYVSAVLGEDAAAQVQHRIGEDGQKVELTQDGGGR